MATLENRRECYICDGSSTNIGAHLAVIRDGVTSAGEPKCKLPTAAGQLALGITDDKATRANFGMSVIRSGRAEAIADSAITAGDRVEIAGTSGRIRTSRASLTTALSGSDNDLVFTAVEKGQEGTEVTIEYVNPGTSASLNIDTQGSGIKVNLAHNGSAITSTAADIKTAIEADTTASALVTVANASSNDGTGVVTAMAETPLGSAGYDFGVAEETATAQYDKIYINIDKAEG